MQKNKEINFFVVVVLFVCIGTHDSAIPKKSRTKPKKSKFHRENRILYTGSGNYATLAMNPRVLMSPDDVKIYHTFDGLTMHFLQDDFIYGGNGRHILEFEEKWGIVIVVDKLAAPTLYGQAKGQPTKL
uniref:Uncharacterized protein n=1 Tax=Glossina austeni TaxID=7395 RepID=A0A1A9V915_GLOAU